MSDTRDLVRHQSQQDRRNGGPVHFAPRREPHAFVIVTLEIVDAEGDALRVETWAWGAGTPQAVLRRWSANHPAMEAHRIGTSVVTAAPAKIVYDALRPVGSRVKVRDRALEKVAVGL